MSPCEEESTPYVGDCPAVFALLPLASNAQGSAAGAEPPPTSDWATELQTAAGPHPLQCVVRRFLASFAGCVLIFGSWAEMAELVDRMEEGRKYLSMRGLRAVLLAVVTGLSFVGCSHSKPQNPYAIGTPLPTMV